jgi:uncharacterized protein (TIGR00266 family)
LELDVINSEQTLEGALGMPIDRVDHRIIGESMQAVIITLDPGEGVVAEAGSFMYMNDGIEMGTQLSMTGEKKGLFGKLFEAGKRALTGDSFFITMFANTAQQRRDVAFAAPYPGTIMPIELGEHGGQLLCQKDSFLCCARGVEVGIAFTRRIGAGLFGGEGFILQKLTSPTGGGQAFLHAGGTVTQHELGAGELLRVDTGCLVAFESTVDYDIQMVPGIKNKLFGGEGLFFAAMRGPGKVWLQTLPFSRMADRIIAAGRGGGKEEGSILGGIGSLLDGDNR